MHSRSLLKAHLQPQSGRPILSPRPILSSNPSPSPTLPLVLPLSPPPTHAHSPDPSPSPIPSLPHSSPSPSHSAARERVQQCLLPDSPTPPLPEFLVSTTRSGRLPPPFPVPEWISPAGPRPRLCFFHYHRLRVPHRSSTSSE